MDIPTFSQNAIIIPRISCKHYRTIYAFLNLPTSLYCFIMKLVETMHEFSITESMLTLALEKANEAKATKITRINLVVGELSGVVSDCVQFYFDHISKDTIASGAELTFETKPTLLRCHECDVIFSPNNSNWNCPDCNKTSIEITSGRECYMESIEVE